MITIKTLVMFDDIFFLCMVGGEENFCLLPEWKDRVIEMKEYKGEV